MRPNSIPMRMVALIRQAGVAGISAEQLCQVIGCSAQSLNVCRARAREAGLHFFTLFRSVKGGGVYYATEAWRDAGELAWQAQVRAQQAQRQEASRVAKPAREKMTDDERRAKRAADKKAYRKRVNIGAHTPKLHAIGEHMKSKARDGKLVTAHQATFDRQRQATVKVQADRPVDYSRAKLTVCPSPPLNRFEPTGPVHSVVNPRECRGWAKAATA